jgi:hypothetical protein
VIGSLQRSWSYFPLRSDRVISHNKPLDRQELHKPPAAVACVQEQQSLTALPRTSRYFFLSMLSALQLVCVFSAPSTAQEPRAADRSEQDFQSSVRPFLERYCFECHAGEDSETDFDLATFATLADVRQQLQVWQTISEVVEAEEMPPRSADHPSVVERDELVGWLKAFIQSESRNRAGDPGPVVLRRLNNAEYTYSLRDLTGVATLEPAESFPVDGATGEGFTNSGIGQGMSPVLITKYLEAAKRVAEHAVLLPDGISFSATTTRRDHTDEAVEEIQKFYRRYTVDGGGTAIDLDGIKFTTNEGGLIPIEKYVSVTLLEREALRSGRKTTERAALDHGVNARYLETLWNALRSESGQPPSLFLDPLRSIWRRAKPKDAAMIADRINRTTQGLWKFNPVGYIGSERGPQSYMEAVTPIAEYQTVRFELPRAGKGSDIVFYLIASDLGDGNENDSVVWEQPRIEFIPDESGETREPILLRDIRSMGGGDQLTVVSNDSRPRQYIDGAADVLSAKATLVETAKARGLDARLLNRWVGLLGGDQEDQRRIVGLMTGKLESVRSNSAINGWGSFQTPLLLANSSAEIVSFASLDIPARGVTVHPSKKLDSVVIWRSPVDAEIRIEGLVADLDKRSGNGVTWNLKRISSSRTTTLQRGTLQNGERYSIRLDQAIKVKRGDLISFVVSAGERDSEGDTTLIELRLAEVSGEMRSWDLGIDVIDRMLTGNPLPDGYDHQGVWNFCARELAKPRELSVPAGSILAHWRLALVGSGDYASVAGNLETFLTGPRSAQQSKQDQDLLGQLLGTQGPDSLASILGDTEMDPGVGYGLDPALFGKHPEGLKLDPADLFVRAPRVIKVRLPADIAAGAVFETRGSISTKSGRAGSVQLLATPSKLDPSSIWPALSLVVSQESTARERMERDMREFRAVFPPALCYALVVPVDEVITLTLFYREDDQLKRLMLGDEEILELDRLWSQLSYVSQEPLSLLVALDQLSEFSTQKRQDLVEDLAKMRPSVKGRADAFSARLLETEAVHVSAVMEFAGRAWRRIPTPEEEQNLRELYLQLRKDGVSHEPAVQLLLARVLTSPSFLYKLESKPSGNAPEPISDLELSTRLSYFLWSSVPDSKLTRLAQAGALSDNRTLIKATNRMLKDPRVRRLAIQFACQWMLVRDFDKNDGKSEDLYPEFEKRRVDMYQECVRFFQDMFTNDGSILGLIDADHTFLNESLAKHYGIDGVEGDAWRRVDDVKSQGRGGILGMGAILASQSGASRTSPILRGNWVYDTLLGEHLPSPPPGVPQLPELVPEGLTARQFTEQHTSVESCKRCHVKVDGYGFAMEQYDAIGRLRPIKVNTQSTLEDGKQIDGLSGLRQYLVQERRDDVVRQFCRKLLGYCLGREVLLSDESLLDRMEKALAKNDYRFSTAVKTLVTSRQFRQKRGSQL